MSTPCLDLSEKLWGELWVSLASLLRSYCAVHGLNGNREAAIEHDAKRILARHRDKWLEIERSGATITWKREDGSRGTLKLTETGRLRSSSDEEEMDLAAEAWARELMQ
ncbi:MAG TPA: transcriptional regulator [Terracidiphilus sp.]|nr:transcriptional regulator [Terracidiphilus sp.]